MNIVKIFILASLLFLAVAGWADNIYPEINEDIFQGKQGVVVLQGKNNISFLGILAKKEVWFRDDSKFNLQKKLSLKTRKILHQYYAFTHKLDDGSFILNISGLLPVTFWLDGDMSFLISIVKTDNVESVETDQNAFVPTVELSQKFDDSRNKGLPSKETAQQIDEP